jgi:hypothetical protein
MKYKTAGKNTSASDDKTVHLMRSFLQEKSMDIIRKLKYIITPHQENVN